MIRQFLVLDSYAPGSRPPAVLTCSFLMVDRDAGRSSKVPVEARSKLRGTARSQRALPIEVASAGLYVRHVTVKAPDVVYVKGILEASEGLGVVFAERGGDLILAAHPDRTAALDELIADLVIEIGASVDQNNGGGT